jgi:hypothetical protein
MQRTIEHRARWPRKRPADFVFNVARRFPNEHELCGGAAFARYTLRRWAPQRATPALIDRGSQLLNRVEMARARFCIDSCRVSWPGSPRRNASLRRLHTVRLNERPLEEFPGHKARELRSWWRRGESNPRP